MILTMMFVINRQLTRNLKEDNMYLLRCLLLRRMYVQGRIKYMELWERRIYVQGRIKYMELWENEM